MKSKKVLLGLILAAFVGSAGFAGAQTKANYQNKLIEIGPDNISGRIRSVVADQSDINNVTIYAGGVAGGLYKMNAENTAWQYVPYVNEQGDTVKVTLPISYMVQTTHDNMIYIATGEGMAVGENANEAFIVPEGRGLFRFNPETQRFGVVEGTQNWKYINRMAYMHRGGVLYFYVATNDGLYRWTVNDNAAWGTPEQVFSGAVQDVEIVSGDNMAFFTSGSHLYKISNVTRPATTNKYTDISTSCAAFGGDALRIELAAAKSDKTYLYAMVADKNGMLDGVYLTNNQQSWTKLTTTSIVPFSKANSGWHNNAITIDPTNHKRIFIGGATLWVGEGYVENSNYQWTMSSYSENELSNGSYMESVVGSPVFVHSGIHQILPVKGFDHDAEGNVLVDVYGDTVWSAFIATDGGVFSAVNMGNFNYFQSYNKGLNTVQFNDIAIAPDGGILGGATDNACPFIQSRNESHGGDINNTWYDNSTRMNHMANVLWFGDGGQVQASMFQQIHPNTRRTLFFSSNGADFTYVSNQGVSSIANYGRAYDDYSNYFNTQTWTSDTAFIGNALNNTNSISQMALFETLNNKANDSITVIIDTLGTFWRNGVEYSFQDKETLKTLDNQDANGSAEYFHMMAGDSIIFGSLGHANYPFTYVFPQAMAIVNHVNDSTVISNMAIRTHNPIASRIFLSGRRASGQGIVRMNMFPSDFRHVWARNTDKDMHWYDVYVPEDYGARRAHQHTGYLVPSQDGDAIFINVIDTLQRNYIVRVSNLNACDANVISVADGQINYDGEYPNMPRITVVDTIRMANDDYLFNRPVTSLSIDPREGQDVLVITFGGETNASEPNLAVVKNATKAKKPIATTKVAQNGIAIYSALVEKTSGTLYIGTDKGVFTAANVDGNPTTVYGDFEGVPVTAIRQQTKDLKSRSFTTHSGINEETYVFAKTKFPNAIYFATYGRGIFMDATYVTDTINEVSIPTINTENKGENTVSVYPNPATTVANINLNVVEGGNAVVRIYDLSGKVVFTKNLGLVDAGDYSYSLNCQNFRNGMYLINVNIGKQSATSKFIVR